MSLLERIQGRVSSVVVDVKRQQDIVDQRRVGGGESVGGQDPRKGAVNGELQKGLNETLYTKVWCKQSYVTKLKSTWSSLEGNFFSGKFGRFCRCEVQNQCC
jgi:hypothetical protein